MTSSEKDVFDSVSHDVFMYYLHNMKLFEESCKRILIVIFVLLLLYDKKFIYMYDNSI